MGATFPLTMAAIRTGHPDAGARAFSFLYLANVLGAALRHARVGFRQAMLTSSLKEESTPFVRTRRGWGNAPEKVGECP